MDQPQRTRKIRRGEIFWLPDCPPLDGRGAKARPIVVLGEFIKGGKPLLIVAISHTASQPERDPDMIRLPDLQQSPQVKTGLNKPSWAIPRWWAVVSPERLGASVGYLSGDSLRKLIVAVTKRVDAANRLLP